MYRGYVYLLDPNNNGDTYVGSSISFCERMSNHKMRKTEENCSIVDCIMTTKDSRNGVLRNLEQAWIDKLEPSGNKHLACYGADEELKREVDERTKGGFIKIHNEALFEKFFGAIEERYGKTGERLIEKYDKKKIVEEDVLTWNEPEEP